MEKALKILIAAMLFFCICVVITQTPRPSSASYDPLTPIPIAETEALPSAESMPASPPLPVVTPTVPAPLAPNPTPTQPSPKEIGLRYFPEGSIYGLYIGKDGARQPEPMATPPAEIIEINHVERYSGSYLERMLGGQLPSGKLIQGEREALAGLLRLMDAASEAGYTSQAIRSAYRSFQTQAYLQGANELWPGFNVAEPGRSEHELGTAFDISWRGELMDLKMIQDPEVAAAFYEWLKSNAHTFGFVISYPYKAIGYQNNIAGTFITEYIVEPWHIRYVTPEFARAIFAYQDSAGHNYLAPESTLIPQDFYVSGED